MEERVCLPDWRAVRSSQYVPALGDVVVGRVTKRLADAYKVDVGSSRDLLLPTTAFAGATKQNCPLLEPGDFVLAGVACAHKYHEPLLTCEVLNEAKTWSSKECYLGHLPGGLLIRIPIPFAPILTAKDCLLLQLIGQKIAFEIAVGANALVWVKAATVHDTVMVSQIIKRAFADDFASKGLDDLVSFVEAHCRQVLTI